MQKTALRSTKTDTTIPVVELKRQSEGWLLDLDIKQVSPQTLATRRLFLSKLFWFLDDREYPQCGTLELRQFLAYLRKGHEDPGGRFGNPHLKRPISSRTLKDYYTHLRTFFRWLIKEGVLEVSPLEAIDTPISRADQIQPFTEAQVYALLSASKKSRHPRRDEAVLLFMLDTGIRASELGGLRRRDIDIKNKKAIVLGKGNKRRAVYFGKSTAKALWQYLNEEPHDDSAPVFLSDRGLQAGEALTRWGVRQIIERLGQTAKIEATRCSAHTVRHTFAVNFLRNGGQVFALKEMLGHTDLKMTNRYVAFAQADIENQHRQYSPVDSLKRR